MWTAFVVATIWAALVLLFFLLGTLFGGHRDGGGPRCERCRKPVGRQYVEYDGFCLCHECARWVNDTPIPNF